MMQACFRWAIAWLAASPAAVGAAPSASPQPILRRVYVGDFISPERQAQAGVVVDATADSILLRPGDAVTLRYPQAAPVAVGDRLISYARARPLTHPHTHQILGYVTEVAGVLQVAQVAGAFAEATLVSAATEVERGQQVAALTQPMYIDVPMHAPNVALSGEVLAVAHALTMGREQRQIYLDRGAADGLRVGDVLQVAGRRDTIHSPAEPAQRSQPVARVVVVATQAHTATAQVVDALWEVAVGNVFAAVPGAN